VPKTWKPRPASRAAVAAPIPEDAPVTSTLCPMRSSPVRAAMLPPAARRRRRGGTALLRARFAIAALLVLALALACREPAQDGPAASGETIFLAIGGETFTLELALDPATRQRGLSGRRGLPRNGGMLFAFGSPRPLAMVMRDCPEPIDVAFLDGEGRVVALHAMLPEPPRREGESAVAYERRLPEYPSAAPAQFAIEVAGGRLAELGVEVGTRLRFDAAALARRAR
jgi:uncharacterized membrane protein (UPF0127 family)